MLGRFFFITEKKEGRKERRKEGKQEKRKEGRKKEREKEEHWMLYDNPLLNIIEKIRVPLIYPYPMERPILKTPIVSFYAFIFR